MKSRTSMLVHQAPGLNARQGSRSSKLFESAAALLVMAFPLFRSCQGRKPGRTVFSLLPD
jgi:hypothetical protein